MMTFIEFLDALANDILESSFTEGLITTPTPYDNHYYNQGDRWCGVEELLANSNDTRELLRKYAFHGLDPNLSFSSGNLKAQYIPDEDFINDGSAIIVFAIVGSQWMHCVQLKGQSKLLARLSNESF